MHVYGIFTYIQIYTDTQFLSLAAELEKQKPRTTNRSEHKWPPVPWQLQPPGPGQ